MKRKYFVSIISALLVILTFFLYDKINQEEDRTIKVGYIYVGDASTPYTYNFMKAQESIEALYGDKVENIARYNVAEGYEEPVLRQLAESGCDLIFGASFGYGDAMKKVSKEYPNVEFCHATGLRPDDESEYPNYHTFMGWVYQGRYVSGVVAGMKMKELIDQGKITPDQVKIGYVGAFPYAEVISGYTAFFLGVRSIVPEAIMHVKYTNTWSDYKIEKKYAEELIEEGCLVIAQHSDTVGPAVACENTNPDQHVYHVSYNRSMLDAAPTTSLVGCRINWDPYMQEAVGAVLKQKKIEDLVDAVVNGTDAGAGFDKNWVQMLELNEIAAAQGTEQVIQDTIKKLDKKSLKVFQGDYLGVDPFDETDTLDLNQGFEENQYASAAAFHYVLKDVIIIDE